VIGDGRLLDVVEEVLTGTSFSKSSWFSPPSSWSSIIITDKLDDEDDDDMAYSIEDVFSPEGERQLDEKLTRLARQTKIIDTVRRGRYMFK
jgi:hypothetical protein